MTKKTYNEIYSDAKKCIVRSEADSNVVGLRNDNEVTVVCDDGGEFSKYRIYMVSLANMTSTRRAADGYRAIFPEVSTANARAVLDYMKNNSISEVLEYKQDMSSAKVVTFDNVNDANSAVTAWNGASTDHIASKIGYDTKLIVKLKSPIPMDNDLSLYQIAYALTMSVSPQEALSILTYMRNNKVVEFLKYSNYELSDVVEPVTFDTQDEADDFVSNWNNYSEEYEINELEKEGINGHIEFPLYAARGISIQMRTPDELVFEDGVTLKPVDGGDVFVVNEDNNTIHIGTDYNAATGGCTVNGTVYENDDYLNDADFYVIISAFTAYKFATGTIVGIGYETGPYYITPGFTYPYGLQALLDAGYYITSTVPTQTTVWRLSDDAEGTRYTGSESDAAVVSGNSKFYYGTIAECNAVWATKFPPTALCFTNVDEGISSVKLSVNGTLTTDYETSPDGINWSAYTMGTAISLETGGKVYFRGTRSTQSAYNYLQFSMTGKIAASGNCNSLLAKTGFDAITDLASYSRYVFYRLFLNCSQLTMAPALPATTLRSNCYQEMFRGCTSLTSAPALPATSLATYCYYEMFRGCTSLISAPALPATSLATYCYYEMFYGCTSLTSAPALPATSLATYCYYEMFYGCTSLISAPALPATSLAGYCYGYMFRGCTSLTSAPALPATSLATYCYCAMFYGCTSLTSAPELPATTLDSSCYLGMFHGCTSLNEVHCDATDISATDCTNDWLSGVSSTGTFYKNPDMNDWTTGSSGIPTGWNVRYMG